ncbi:thioesterase domain-containing protein, partial [Streptomyces sp. NPDC048484]|uniref:thioesterase domain-containing protein n=1 Tax=Streptomyces sp. NPDC048484 TaxID=3155146 RepID=UPI00343F3574
AFLDGLAVHRRAQGLAGQSLAWGLWEQTSGMTGTLDAADRSRLARSGILPLPTDHALTLLDTATTLDDPTLIPIRLDLKVLATTELPRLLSGLVRTVRRRAAVDRANMESLRHRLAGMPEAQQGLEVLNLVLESAAEVLGHSSSDNIDPQRNFLESGFDSLTAMQLRNILNESVGLRLPPMVVFDNKNPAELARYIRSKFEENLLGGGAETAGEHDGRTGASTEDDRADTLSQLFRDAVASGNVPKGFAMLRAVADLRPEFNSLADLDKLPAPVKLADGQQAPRLICLSTPMVAGGVHQHARLVSSFRGARHVSVLPMPGFASGESLPASADAVVEVLAESVLRAAEGEPFVLLGYSSGGVVAYAVADHLEKARGVTSTGVVLLDSYKVEDNAMPNGFEHMAARMLDMESVFGRYDSARLSAMSHYSHLLPAFSLGSIEAPVLFIGVDESFVVRPDGSPDTGDFLRARPWDSAHSLRIAPGNHFTLVEDHADSTAAVIEDWIASIE